MDLPQYELQPKFINYSNLFIISDLHFGVRSNSLEWLQNQLNFFSEFYVPFLKENIKENDHLIITGDFHDSRQLLDINILNSSIDLMIQLSNIIPVIILIGNHDIYAKYSTDISSLKIFKYIKNVTIFDKPSIITNNKNKILILPWIGDKEKEENFIKASNVDYVFAHTDIVGFKYDNGKNIIKGTDFLSVNNKIKRIFSGHIHKRQEQDKLIYVGSPYHTKRSDIGNQKGVYVFNPNNNTYHFVQNNISPVFQRIKLEDLLEWQLSYVKSILSNNYTDIIVPDKYIHQFNLTKFIELLKDCNYKKIETISEKVKIDDFIGIVDGEEIKDILTLLEISIDDLGLSSEKIIKLKSLNKQYYEKSSKKDE